MVSVGANAHVLSSFQERSPVLLKFMAKVKCTGTSLHYSTLQAAHAHNTSQY